MGDTRQRILDTARGLFNEAGLARVGVREIARAGHLERRAALARTDLLFEQGELISSGWLNAATVRGWRDDEETIRHFAKVGVALLEPCCTPRGAREMRRILSGDLDRKPEP